MPGLGAQELFLFLPSFFLSAGASYARLPTPPQAQQDLLVLTMPAPQGSRVACWVPHFSTGIPANAAGLPQECFLTTASVTGTNREQEREREKGNTVIKSEEREVSHTATQTHYRDLPVKDYFRSIVDEPVAQEALKLRCICNITPLEMSEELKPSNECCHHGTPRLWVMRACFSLSPSHITFALMLLQQGGRQDTDRLVSCVSEHAGAGGDTGLCAYCMWCVWVCVYTCNQVDSSRSNETEMETLSC